MRAVLFEGGGEVEARSVVVSTGVSYRRLEADGMERLQGKGVYYGATAAEAAQTDGDLVYVVGWRELRRPGRAELRPPRQAGHARRARTRPAGHHVDVPGRPDQRRPPNITVRCGTEVAAADGDTHLERLTLAERGVRPARGGRGLLALRVHRRVTAHRLARRLGRPRRARLRAHRARGGRARTRRGACARAPFALETSLPGVFAAGDVRLESMKRVASAVGEGAMSIYLVHRYLATV